MNLGINLMLILLLFFFIYDVIPELFFHWLGIGSWKRQYGPGVALTFDDGPHPEITPQILEVLARHKVTATFFIVGEMAVRHPELIAQIVSQNHRIGAHSQHHRHAWIMSPWASWRDWNQSIATLELLTGQPVEWVRPPWGAFNLASWFWIMLNRKRVVLWNADGRDWRGQQTPDKITTRILDKVDEGSIVLLHDAGGDLDAPGHTLQALDQICRRIVEEKKLPLRDLEFPDWSSWRRGTFRIWEKWEHLFSRIYHLQRIDAYNVFRICRTRYKGPALLDQDGQVVAREGDLVAELHLDNIRMQGKSSNPNVIAVQALRQTRESLPNVARFVSKAPDYRGINIFQGLTVIHQGVKGLGFTVQEVPGSWYNTAIGLLQGTVGQVYRPWDKTRKQTKMRTTTKMVWISRQALLNRWMPADDE
ncbi:MAG TPA: polysaccharide deacetylase family protein [Syntrophomonadaceae bacterium]|nr:polysaccharide deacetylase family protein [Syntrophomonadaceae bacterium]